MRGAAVRGLAIGLTFLGCAACHGKQRGPELFRLATSGSRFESSNGYVFIVLPDPSSHMVRVDVRYPVGSAMDPVGREGVAHLVEHLLFAVEVPRAGRATSIGAELGRLAYYWNAETALDYTHYVSEAAPGALDELLRLETERTAIGCRGITPAVFEREKEIVVDELRQRQGASGSVLVRRLNEALYPVGHPYRRADSVDAVRRIQPADVCRFLRNTYPLGKAIVVVSGAVTDAEVRASAGRYFAAMPQRNVAGLSVPRPVAPAPGRVHVRANVDELTLLAGWPLPPRATREFRLLEPVGGIIASRLGGFASLYKWGRAPVSGVVGGEYAPQLVVAIALDSPSDVDEAVGDLERAVDGTFRYIHEPLTSVARVPRWRRAWLPLAAQLVSRYESVGPRAQMLADFAQFDTGTTGLVGRVRDFDQAEPAEVRELAEEWLDPDRARFVIIEPDAGALERVTSVSSFVAAPEVHRVSVDLAEADRPLEVPRVSLAIKARRFTAPGGLEVVVWTRRASPLVRAALVLDSGTAHEPPGQEGVALLQGSDEAYDDHLIFAAADFRHELRQVVLETIQRLYVGSGWMSEDAERAMKTRLRRALAGPRVSYELDLVRALYGAGHPYAHPGMTEASLAALDGDRLEVWRLAHAVTSNATLVVAGDVDRELLDGALAYAGVRVKAGQDSPDVDRRPVTTPGFVLGGATGREPLVELDVAFVGGRGIDRSHALRLVLSEVLTAKLATLREEDALSYGFSAGYAPRVAGGLWRLSGKVPVARAAEAARLIERTLDAMRASPDAYRAEFVHARRTLVEALAGSAADSSAVLDRLVLIERFGLAPGYFDQLLSEIARLRIDEMHAFLTTELASGRQVFGAFGPRAAAAAALAAAREEQSRMSPARAP